jgi:predicted aspartyl protease
MGITTVKVAVSKSRESKERREAEFIVDSEAVYSVVRGPLLRQLGCKPSGKRDFFLADGTKVSRHIGDAYFEYFGVGGPAPVVSGEKHDKTVLGMTTLEALELVLDPFSRELRPMTMSLPGMAVGRAR